MGVTEFRFFQNDGTGTFRRIGGMRLNRQWGVIPGNFSRNAAHDVLCYNSGDGVAALYAVDGQGHLSAINEDVLPRPATHPGKWEHCIIVKGHFARDSKYDDLLIYSPDDWGGAFYSFDDAGKLHEVGRFTGHMDYDRTLKWDIIVAGYFAAPSSKVLPGASGLLCYDRRHGTGNFYTVGDGSKTYDLRLYPKGGWRTTWSRIVPIRFGLDKSSTDALLFYDGSEGTGHFFVTDGHGGIAFPKDRHGNTTGKYTGGWSKKWTAIIAGSFFTPNDILFHEGFAFGDTPYDIPDASGEVKIYPVDKYAKISTPKVLSPQKGQNVVVGNFFPTPGKQHPHDILFYHSIER